MRWRIAFLGEAWGWQEEKHQKAFVGDAGRELWQWSPLQRSALTLVSNLCNVRPPRNRDPKPEEVLKEWPRLMKELERAAPNLIVTFGRLPAGYLLGKPIFMEVYHGLPLDPKSVVRHPQFDRFQLGALVSSQLEAVMPCYHPAAVLHNPELYKFFVEDMQNLKLFINNELTWKVNHERGNYHISGSVPCGSVCGKAETWVAVDTEGTRESPICMTISDSPKRGTLVYLPQRQL